MSPDADLHQRLALLAGPAPDPDAAYGGVIARGRRRLTRHRVGLAGAVIVVAGTSLAGAFALGRDTEMTTTVGALGDPRWTPVPWAILVVGEDDRTLTVHLTFGDKCVPAGSTTATMTADRVVVHTYLDLATGRNAGSDSGCGQSDTLALDEPVGDRLIVDGIEDGGELVPWTDVRPTGDRTLRVSFTTGVCTIDFRAQAIERPEEVVVQVTRRDEKKDCLLVGLSEETDVDLASPLDGRRILDGALLAQDS